MGVASALEMLCVVILGVLLFGILIKGMKLDNTANRLFVVLLIVLMCAVYLDHLTWKMEGTDASFLLYQIIWALSYPAFASTVAVFHFYFIHHLGTRVKFGMWIRFLALPVAIVTTVIWEISMFNGMIYTLHEGNYAVFNDNMYLLVQLPNVVIALMDVVLTICLGKKLGWRETIVFCFYGLIPIAATLNQEYLETAPIYVAATVSAVLIYVMIHVERDRRLVQSELELAKQQAELQDSRARIMMSQIQPHFLYNALNSIYYLAGQDAEKAQNAISDFADYLRMNLDSLKRVTKVTFEEELRHTKTYVNLERMRFGEILSVIYDISYRDFEIPALSLQPLVENAVKYGVCQKDDGGTIVISTRKREQHVEMIIEDDGIGFDVDEQKKDGRSHIGLANVKERIKAMCGGEMFVESEIGKGTKITISIPIEGQEIFIK